MAALESALGRYNHDLAVFRKIAAVGRVTLAIWQYMSTLILLVSLKEFFQIDLAWIHGLRLDLMPLRLDVLKRQVLQFGFALGCWLA